MSLVFLLESSCPADCRRRQYLPSLHHSVALAGDRRFTCLSPMGLLRSAASPGPVGLAGRTWTDLSRVPAAFRPAPFGARVAAFFTSDSPLPRKIVTGPGSKGGPEWPGAAPACVVGAAPCCPVDVLRGCGQRNVCAASFHSGSATLPSFTRISAMSSNPRNIATVSKVRMAREDS